MLLSCEHRWALRLSFPLTVSSDVTALEVLKTFGAFVMLGTLEAIDIIRAVYHTKCIVLVQTETFVAI